MRNIVFIIVILCITSCVKEEKTKYIVGLWEVKKVEVGKNKMTPKARWMKFNVDLTQSSGNGWLQHSIGSYNLNNNYLSIYNSNGVKDNAKPFQIESFDETSMIWFRLEEGQSVKVFLERINEIPMSSGNKLLGLWKLDSIKLRENSKDNFKNFDPNPKANLFIRWDNTFVNQSVIGEKKYGVYKIHGHKPEIQMVNYGESPKFKFYKFKFNHTNLILTSIDKKKEMVYSRIHQFPK